MSRFFFFFCLNFVTEKGEKIATLLRHCHGSVRNAKVPVHFWRVMFHVTCRTGRGPSFLSAKLWGAPRSLAPGARPGPPSLRPESAPPPASRG